jgi:hypothetical protein
MDPHTDWSTDSEDEREYEEKVKKVIEKPKKKYMSKREVESEGRRYKNAWAMALTRMLIHRKCSPYFVDWS